MEATATKERPILFSGPMTRAILSGDKTQTRRIVKGAPINPGAYLLGLHAPSGVWGIHADVNHDEGVWRGKCPFGFPGHRLWVRETWATDLHNEQDSPSRIKELCEDAGYRVDPGHPAGPIWYQSDGAVRRWGGIYVDVQGRWRPSIHMPRWASRITLEITNIRVERLQEISEEDAQAEGFRKAHLHGYLWTTAKSEFLDGWNRIHGPGSWELNPWVWVVEFKRITEQRTATGH